MKSKTYIVPTIHDIVVGAWYEKEVDMQKLVNTCIIAISSLLLLTFTLSCWQVQEECDNINCKEKQSILYSYHLINSLPLPLGTVSHFMEVLVLRELNCACRRSILANVLKVGTWPTLISSLLSRTRLRFMLCRTNATTIICTLFYFPHCKMFLFWSLSDLAQMSIS